MFPRLSETTADSSDCPGASVFGARDGIEPVPDGATYRTYFCDFVTIACSIEVQWHVAPGRRLQPRGADYGRRADRWRVGGRRAGCAEAEGRHLVRLERRDHRRYGGRASRGTDRGPDHALHGRSEPPRLRRILPRLRQRNVVADAALSDQSRAFRLGGVRRLSPRERAVRAGARAPGAAGRSGLGARLPSARPRRGVARCRPAQPYRPVPAHAVPRTRGVHDQPGTRRADSRDVQLRCARLPDGRRPHCVRRLRAATGRRHRARGWSVCGVRAHGEDRRLSNRRARRRSPRRSGGAAHTSATRRGCATACSDDH